MFYSNLTQKVFSHFFTRNKQKQHERNLNIRYLCDKEPVERWIELKCKKCKRYQERKKYDAKKKRHPSSHQSLKYLKGLASSIFQNLGQRRNLPWDSPEANGLKALCFQR
jgi:hypothetical protein